MRELRASMVTIQDKFWSPRLHVNAVSAIFHQWAELEKSGCIDNFRIICGEKDGFREGWVFADSDAYKWLDAAARIQGMAPDPSLKKLIDNLLALIGRTQETDGYIYTYNQFHFFGQRWVNLQIEHELYCHGHLIEGCISHFEATAEKTALNIACKAADLLVKDFSGGPPELTDGHQEIEIALLRLYQVAGCAAYLDLSRQFIEARGRIESFDTLFQRELASYEERKAFVRRERARYASTHPEYAVSKIPADNEAQVPPRSAQRRMFNTRSGKYNQQHAPVRKQTIPEGHSVRFGYFQTATALLHRVSGDKSLLPALKKSWERMVTRRMYVTGGLGSLPGNEGFGHDYELDPEYAYTETCAALASMFWNWEMALATGEAKYSDLFEWQLYNAASVGMGDKGNTYLYNNPLKVQGGIIRRPWYSVPCCPSNLSRTWANLGKYIYSYKQDVIWIHQYIGNTTHLEIGVPVEITIQSGLPFDGRAIICLNPAVARTLSLYLRLPSWSSKAKLYLNGNPLNVETTIAQSESEPTAQGYDPRLSRFIEVRRKWQPGDTLEMNFDMVISLRLAHPKVRGHAGKTALTCGPLVYCLESIDNPEVDIFRVKLNPASLRAEHNALLLGGVTILRAESDQHETLVFIPYQLWGNRGPSQMNVWIESLPDARSAI